MYNIYNYLNIKYTSNILDIIQAYKNKIKLYNNIELTEQHYKEIKLLKICLYILSNKILKKKYDLLLQNNKSFNIMTILNNKFNNDNLIDNQINEYQFEDNYLYLDNLENKQINDLDNVFNNDNKLINNLENKQINYKKKKIENSNLTNRIFNELSSNNINILY